MNSSTLNWSALLKKDFETSNHWPDIGRRKDEASAQKANDLQTKSSSGAHVDEVLKPFEKLQINSYSRENDTRTREEILEERKQRKNVRKEEKARERYQQKLFQRNAPKSDKLKTINKEFMEKMIQNSNKFESTKNSQKFRLKPQGKRANNLEINLFDFMKKSRKHSKEENKEKLRKTSKKTFCITRHKGKKREIPKKKWISKLKRSILLSRKLRKKQFEEQSLDKSINLSLTKSSTLNPEAPIFSPRHANLVEPLKSVNESKTLGENIEKLSDENFECKNCIQFTRKFRPYCNNFITTEICTLTETLLRDVFRFQDRAYQKNPIKACASKRFVVGFKETQRQLTIRKIKLLIIAPDLEKADGEGGIVEVVESLKKKCQESEVAYVFAISRWKIGRILLKKVPVSCVAILNYEGAEDTAKNLLEIVLQERIRFLSNLG